MSRTLLRPHFSASPFPEDYLGSPPQLHSKKTSNTAGALQFLPLPPNELHFQKTSSIGSSNCGVDELRPPDRRPSQQTFSAGVGHLEDNFCAICGEPWDLHSPNFNLEASLREELILMQTTETCRLSRLATTLRPAPVKP